MSDGYISTPQYSIPLLVYYSSYPAFQDSSFDVVSFLPGDSVPGRRSWTFDDDSVSSVRAHLCSFSPVERDDR
jgi:hypothetical protein